MSSSLLIALMIYCSEAVEKGFFSVLCGPEVEV
jgi:hypothetical protein